MTMTKQKKKGKKEEQKLKQKFQRGQNQIYKD